MDLQPMDVMKPINLSTNELDETHPLTVVEMGKLWATYMGNRMSSQISAKSIWQNVIQEKKARTGLFLK